MLATNLIGLTVWIFRSIFVKETKNPTKLLQNNTTTHALVQHLGGGLTPPMDVRVLAVYTSSMRQAY